MDKHFTICVGRQFGSGGRSIAQLVGQKLGVSVYDRNLLKTASENTGFSEELFEKADEEQTRKGLRGFFMNHFSGAGMPDNYLSNESIFNMQADAIRKIHENEDCIIVGRCADYVLRDSDRLLSVFIAASVDDRVARICRQENLSQSRALSNIEQQDRDRAAYFNYYTGRVWGDPTFYDMCLNSTNLGYGKCADMIVELAKERLGI